MLDLHGLFVPGTTYEEIFTVDVSDTVGHYSPSLASLLSTAGLTNRLLHMLRDFCDMDLPEGFVTVAHSLSMTHLETVMVGTKLRVVLTLEALEGNKLKIDFVVNDAMGPVTHGRTERAVVSAPALLEATEARRLALADLEALR